MYKLIRPILFLQNPEKAHHRMHALAMYAGEKKRLKKIVSHFCEYTDSALEVKAKGLSFANPVGLAAGFDKTADLLTILPSLGFGFSEIGSITALAREGNEKPRLFRLKKDQAIINRMGLNNDGADVTAEKIAQQKNALPIGINIAKTHDPSILGDDAIEDFVYSTRRLYDVADYITINVSCPNTAEGKTFEDPSALNTLLEAIMSVRAEKAQKKPIFVKFSPDRTKKEIEELLVVTEKHHVDGYVLTNTSSQRNDLRTPTQRLDAIGMGGLSGKPIQKSSTEMISFVYDLLEKPFIIGVGGIFTAEDAYDKICAGASLLQAYTGFVYEGPQFAKKINRGLLDLLRKDGFSSITEATGIYHQ